MARRGRREWALISIRGLTSGRGVSKRAPGADATADARGVMREDFREMYARV